MMDEKGYIQIYTGDGKGKTTAAIGQSIRAAGSGIPVLFVQFLKDGTSSEMNILKNLPNIQVDYATENFGFYKTMTDETKQKAQTAYTRLLLRNIQLVMQAEKRMLLVLDEIMAAYQFGFIEKELFLEFLSKKPEQLEIVMTGRNPPKELLDIADYITVMQKEKHPFDKGIKAREGIEF